MGINVTTLVVAGTNCLRSCKTNYVTIDGLIYLFIYLFIYLSQKSFLICVYCLYVAILLFIECIELKIARWTLNTNQSINQY